MICSKKVHIVYSYAVGIVSPDKYYFNGMGLEKFSNIPAIMSAKKCDMKIRVLGEISSETFSARRVLCFEGRGEATLEIS